MNYQTSTSTPTHCYIGSLTKYTDRESRKYNKYMYSMKDYLKLKALDIAV
jgi:flagellum-specific peptidoglycan hydrolase FlgJ